MTWLGSRLLCGVVACALAASCVLCAAPAHAEPSAPLQGDEYRYPQLWLIPRATLSVVAAPANVLRWDGWDYTRFGLVTGATIGLMLPAEPSGDVRFQRYVQARRGAFGDAVLFHVNTVNMTISIVAFTAIVFGTAWATDHAPLLEYGDLMLEALAVTQVYHVVPKLLLGREGPHQGTHRGRFYGPTRVFFPGGTPSGHAASTFTILTVAGEYFDSWPLRILALAAGVYVSTSLVYHDSHFLSDVLWGGALGYYVAHWVVRHRSSRHRYGEDGAIQRIALVPMRYEHDTFGAALVGQF
jgi:membrane-associated phospholipid phosphatase